MSLLQQAMSEARPAMNNGVFDRVSASLSTVPLAIQDVANPNPQLGTADYARYDFNPSELNPGWNQVNPGNVLTNAYPFSVERDAAGNLYIPVHVIQAIQQPLLDMIHQQQNELNRLQLLWPTPPRDEAVPIQIAALQDRLSKVERLYEEALYQIETFKLAAKELEINE